MHGTLADRPMTPARKRKLTRVAAEADSQIDFSEIPPAHGEVLEERCPQSLPPPSPTAAHGAVGRRRGGLAPAPGRRLPVETERIAAQSDAGRNPPLGPISIADWRFSIAPVPCSVSPIPLTTSHQPLQNQPRALKARPISQTNLRHRGTEAQRKTGGFSAPQAARADGRADSPPDSGVGRRVRAGGWLQNSGGVGGFPPGVVTGP